MGKNRPIEGNNCSYSNMFDNNDLTYWHGFEPATLNNKVIVSFKKTILFHKLVFTARSDVIHSQERYHGVCLYLDHANSACTPRHRNTTPGDNIELNPLKVTKVKTVELRYPAHVAAAIAELQIYYNFANDAAHNQKSSQNSGAGDGIHNLTFIFAAFIGYCFSHWLM